MERVGDMVVTPRKGAAFRSVLLVGMVVSFFADFVHECAQSLTGPFLARSGTSTIVGIVAGVGELLGYRVRLVSWKLADRSGQFWPITLTSTPFFLRVADAMGPLAA